MIDRLPDAARPRTRRRRARSPRPRSRSTACSGRSRTSPVSATCSTWTSARSLTHDELLEHHHAVIYATGAVAGPQRSAYRARSCREATTATDFVAWYNGHPDHADDTFDLSGERAVIVGNGNVALDVARILSIDPDPPRGAPTSPTTLWHALRESAVREVVLLGRRGTAQAAFTLPELIGLLSRTTTSTSTSRVPT